jgi:ComF family protein
MGLTKAKKTFIFTLQSLNQLLWPPVCINCGKSICQADRDLCRQCWAQLMECTGADYCGRCGRDVSKYAIVEGACPDCQARKFHFDGIARAGVYRGPLQQIILSLKNGRTELDAVVGFLGKSTLEASRFYDDVELLVPVPLHWSRRLSRGYNQSYLLAKRLKHPAAEISTDLIRIRRTQMQPVMTSPTARARNVAGAFAVRPKHNFTNRNICLVDDIKTSGATLNECAKTLKHAGASKVFALVLAVAGQDAR